MRLRTYRSVKRIHYHKNILFHTILTIVCYNGECTMYTIHCTLSNIDSTLELYWFNLVPIDLN